MLNNKFLKIINFLNFFVFLISSYFYLYLSEVNKYEKTGNDLNYILNNVKDSIIKTNNDINYVKMSLVINSQIFLINSKYNNRFSILSHPLCEKIIIKLEGDVKIYSFGNELQPTLNVADGRAESIFISKKETLCVRRGGVVLAAVFSEKRKKLFLTASVRINKSKLFFDDFRGVPDLYSDNCVVDLN